MTDDHQTIRVHIERLVLEGVPLAPGEGPRLQAALEAELGRLIAAHGLDAGLLSGGARPALRAGTLSPAPGDDAQGLGRGIARAVFEGIGHEP
jgi:hypothetical protein